ncbi:MAG: hypothetical protein KZQ93_05910 [Candidatus Thiodiazotropha sp. (ex Monitilora ramsayi)]|nr:hypothetical protein [Candidatus Thiodiazotropha sp. (ex Monitilora ramsayi)]
MNFKLNPIYKRLLAFIVVIGPIFWLVFTEDGQRRTDSVVLFLWGEDEIHLNLEALDDQFTEAQLKEVFPDIQWQCQDEASSFGNRLCASRIGTFNSMPARYITVFFHDQWVNGLKVVYRRIYHDQLIQQLFQQMGNPITENMKGSETPQADTILRWDTGKGNVILKHVLNEAEEPALLWLPHSVMPLGG